MVIKQGEEARKLGVITLEDNRRTFKIYDCPTELISKYISFAKLHFGNQVWKVMEKGMNLILEEEKEWRIQTEKRLTLLEDAVFKKQEEDKGPITFGGGEK